MSQDKLTYQLSKEDDENALRLPIVFNPELDRIVALTSLEYPTEEIKKMNKRRSRIDFLIDNLFR